MKEEDESFILVIVFIVIVNISVEMLLDDMNNPLLANYHIIVDFLSKK